MTPRKARQHDYGSGVSVIMRKRANIMSLAVIQLILHVLRTMYTVFVSQLQYILPISDVAINFMFLIAGQFWVIWCQSDQQVASTTSS